MADSTAHACKLEDLPPELASRIIVNLESGCWEWQHKSGRDPDRYGYVKFRGKVEQIYRVTYKLLVGPIPPDRPHLDHVKAWGCVMHACCWPGHLEPVTPGENARRKGLFGWGATHAGATHCPQKHPYDDENTYIAPKTGARHCKICRGVRRREHRERQRQKITQGES